MYIIDETYYITDDHLLVQNQVSEWQKLNLMRLAGVTVKGDIQNNDPYMYTFVRQILHLPHGMEYLPCLITVTSASGAGTAT